MLLSLTGCNRNSKSFDPQKERILHGGMKRLLVLPFHLQSSFYISFLFMQVTPKTLADVKGGTLISYEGRVQVQIFYPLGYDILKTFYFDFFLMKQKLLLLNFGGLSTSLQCVLLSSYFYFKKFVYERFIFFFFIIFFFN